MSPTVHKVLVHGHQIIKNSLVSVGCLGEHASESRNKFYKSDRKRHARKCSRLDNVTDVFNRALDTSDPFLSTIFLKERQNKNKKKDIPKEVFALLQSPSLNILTNNDKDYQGEDEEDHVDQDADEEYDKDIELDVITSDEEYIKIEEN